MADIHIDIERMIMHSNYLLEVDNSSASNGLSDMERKQYLDQIKELVQTVQTLLDANIALGNKQKELQAVADRKIAGLQAQVGKLTGELQARRRKMHGKNNEKQIGDKSVNTGKELMAYTKIGSVLIDKTVVNAQSAHSQISERTSVDLAVSRVPESQRPSLLSLKPAS